MTGKSSRRTRRRTLHVCPSPYFIVRRTRIGRGNKIGYLLALFSERQTQSPRSAAFFFDNLLLWHERFPPPTVSVVLSPLMREFYHGCNIEKVSVGSCNNRQKKKMLFTPPCFCLPDSHGGSTPQGSVTARTMDGFQTTSMEHTC